jgi:uncharacterized protein involved in exopolysaccharide biosynthesis
MTGASNRVPGHEPNPLRDAVAELILRWRMLLALPVLGGLGAGLLTLVFPAQYESVAIFSPADDISAGLPGNLQAIAAQFGVTASTPGYNVYYFAQVLQSRAVLSRVAADTLSVAGSRTPVTDLVGTADVAPEDQVDETVKELLDVIRIRTDDQSNLVTVTVRARSPELAAALAAAVLSALDSVTIASIRRGGSAERRFAEAQADSARDALRNAEDRLRDFYIANRSIATSPSLQAEEARLRRQIQIQQDLYLVLVNQAETAKLREVKNTPAIALVQPPQASTEKAWPKAPVWALSVAIGLFTVVSVWLYMLRPLLPETALARLPRWLTSSK